MRFIVRFFARVFLGILLGGSKKVGFLIGGVQKGGTSALDSYLRRHDDILMGKVKEIHFFDNEDVYRFPRFMRDAWYHSFFDSLGGGKIKGEATPIYIWWSGAIHRIHAYNPDIKLIFIFRDPVLRAYSHWNMEVQKGNEVRPFPAAIDDSLDNLYPIKAKQHRIYSYVERGFYYEQMKEVYKYFNKSQVLCLTQEDLQESPQAVLDKVTNYLGVSSLAGVERESVHKRDYNAVMSEIDYARLREVYRSDILNFGDLTGVDVSGWL